MKPSLRTERDLLRAGYRVVAGVDEVGRGCLAGPVTVGVTVVDAASRTAPQGLRDSKDLAPSVRASLVPKITRWALGCGVGSASNAEIDAVGIMAAMRRAARRAFAHVAPFPDVVILDGHHDWLAGIVNRPVVTMIKADGRCSSVAAASVLAKEHRDAYMTRLAPEHPAYAWERNKGYASAAHRVALRDYGATQYHRRSWNLTGQVATQEVMAP